MAVVSDPLMDTGELQGGLIDLELPEDLLPLAGQGVRVASSADLATELG